MFNLLKKASRMWHSRIYRNQSNKETCIQLLNLNHGCATSGYFGKHFNLGQYESLVIKIDLLLYRSQCTAAFLKLISCFAKTWEEKSKYTISNAFIQSEHEQYLTKHSLEIKLEKSAVKN